MKKNILFIFLTTFLCFASVFAACNEPDNDNKTETFYTVKIAVDNKDYGTVSETVVTGITKDTVVTVAGNKLVIGDVEITATPAANTARYTYEFTGFSGNPDKVTGDITVTANFTRTVNQYTVTFDMGEGAAIAPLTRDYGTRISDIISSITVIPPENSQLDKWQIKTEENAYVDLVGSETLTRNMTIKAVYTDTYTVESFSTGTTGVTSKFYNKPSTWAQCNTSVVSSISGASAETNAQVSGQMLKLSVSAHSWGDEVFTNFAGIVSNAFATTDYEYFFVKLYTDWNVDGKGIVFGSGNNRIIIGNRGWYRLKIDRADWENENKFYITPYNDYGETALSFNVYFDEIYYGEDQGEEFSFVANENFVLGDTNVNIERQKFLSGFDGVSCKDAPGITTNGETVYIAWGVSALVVSDMAYDGQFIISYDGGKAFSVPTDYSAISRREGNVIYSIMLTAECYSKKYDTFFALGLEGKSYVNAVAPELESKLVYQLRDKNTLEPVGDPEYLPFPFESPYPVQHGQPIEYENGDFLISFDYNVNGKARVVTVRYSFDGENFTVAKAGTPLINDELYRGYCEPSVAKYGEKYYMTIRSDENAYLAWSDDGLTFSEPVLWKFDDGNVIGSCNTQQAWICHENGLFLVYTRNGANNNHVLRNRAPLFMAKFDEENKCLIKSTEIILVPDRGASLASMIGSCRVSGNVSYICVAENMQADAIYGQTNWHLVAARGADNSIWLIKISSEDVIPENGYTVKITVDKDGYGTVSETVVTGITKDTVVTVVGNKLVIGDVEITATPADTDEHYSYEFTGWTGNPDRITKNKTVTANFTRTALHQYTVTFDMGEGTAIAPLTRDYGTRISDIISSVTVTPPAHYHLVKWQIKTGDNSYADLSGTEILTEDITIKAVYTDTYTVESFSTGTAVGTESFYNKPSTWARCSTSVVSTIGGASAETNAQVSGQMLKLSVSAHSWGDEVFTNFAGIVSNAFATTDYEYFFVKLYTDWNVDGKGIVFGAGNNRIIIGNSGWYRLKIDRADWENENKFYITPYNDYTETALSFNVYFDEIYYSEQADEEFTFVAQETFGYGDTEVTVERQKLFAGFDGQTFKESPNITTDGQNIFIAWGMTKLTDVDLSSYGQYTISSDGGITFSDPVNSVPYSYQEGNTIYAYAETGISYSKKYDIGFGIGVRSQRDVNATVLTGHGYVPMYWLLNIKTGERIGEPKILEMSFEFADSCTWYGQPLECDNGDFLFTFYYIALDAGDSGLGATTGYDKFFSAIAVRYSFDGNAFSPVETGTPITLNVGRGADEPNIAKLGDMYYMTIRTDENAYLAWSNDGLNYTEPVLWRFDDGSILGSCNTQQRWIRHENALYLVYTRKTNENNHVMRRRAPLFMAKFDEENKCLIKSTEIILVPDRGASLASMIGVIEFSENVSFICVAENVQGDPMYGWGDWHLVTARGADNSIWLIKISSEDVIPENGYTVKITVDKDGYGTVSETIVTGITKDTVVTVVGNKLVIGDVEITATPADTDEHYSYEFTGWTGNPDRITKNKTVTANFTRTALHQYTVTFDMGEGTAIASLTRDYGTRISDIISSVTVTPPAHYHLVKWQIKTGDNSYADLSGTEILTEDITLKVEYAINVYTVTWKQGTRVLETDTIEYGELLSYDGDTPVSNNGVFDHWAVGNTAIDLATYVVSSDTEIIAVFLKESYLAVENFSAGSAVSGNNFGSIQGSATWTAETVSSIEGASDEDNAKVNGQMLKLSVNAHAWEDGIYTPFAGLVTETFNSTGFEFVTVKMFVDYTAEASWLWIKIGCGSNVYYVSQSGWIDCKISRTDWLADGRFCIMTRMSDGQALTFRLYFDEITAGYDDINVSIENFSGANLSGFANDFQVGVNTAVTNVTTVSAIAGASDEVNAQVNGSMMAVSVNTWLSSVCYVKTDFDGVITNVFNTTDCDYVVVKMYCDINSSRGWDRVYFGVGASTSNPELWQPGWLEITITRSAWTANPNFYIQPNPGGAGDVQLVFTVYFDEIYGPVQDVNLLTKTGLSATELEGTYVEKSDHSTTVLTAEQLAAYTPVAGDKIVLVINVFGSKPTEYVIDVK